VGCDKPGENHVLNARIKELAREINMQSRMISAIVEKDENGTEPENLDKGSAERPDPRKAMLEEAVRDAIEVLEQSRKSFKSKQLAGLRKKLTEVLLDSNPPA